MYKWASGFNPINKKIVNPSLQKTAYFNAENRETSILRQMNLFLHSCQSVTESELPPGVLIVFAAGLSWSESVDGLYHGGAELRLGLIPLSFLYRAMLAIRNQREL